MNEVWPFHDDYSDMTIAEEQHYCFCKSDEEHELNVFTQVNQLLGCPIAEISTDPNQLNIAKCCILTGRQYIDQLKKLNMLETSGVWSQEYVFTFMTNHLLSECFIRIFAKDYSQARSMMIQHYGTMWGFQYSVESFGDQQEKYDLEEVPLGTVNRYKTYQD